MVALRSSHSDFYGDVILLENAFVPAPDEPKKEYFSLAFISLADLHEVLHSYFSGTLDFPSEATLINEDLFEWNRGNNLWCQIDSTCLRSAFGKIPRAEALAIHFYFSRDPEMEVPLHRYWIHSTGDELFADFFDRMILQGYDHLAELLVEELI